MRPRLLLPLAVALTALAGCGGTERPVAAPTRGPSPTAAPASTAPASTVVVRVGRAAPVRAEVADTADERAVGLMRRTSVPLGTGMVFRYDAASTGRYYMFQVPVPLTAVFASGGRVVGVVDMPPCTEPTPQACQTYGPDAPFDTVLETAPETLRGRVTNGDRLVVSG